MLPLRAPSGCVNDGLSFSAATEGTSVISSHFSLLVLEQDSYVNYLFDIGVQKGNLLDVLWVRYACVSDPAIRVPRGMDLDYSWKY